MSKIKFNELPLSDDVLRAIDEMGFTTPSKIQEKAIPEIIKGRDLIGQAQTGTGKTLAFGSALLSELHHSDHIQAIVLSPTRELASQIYEQFKRIGKYTDLRFTCVYGGSEIEKQIRTIKRGVDVLIGTPGRVMDLMRRKVVKLDHLVYFVLDEADEMLNMGFVDDIETILSTVPETRQTVLFSATMPDGIKKIASNYMKHDYLHIRIKEKQQTATTVKQFFYVAKPKQKFEVLCRILDSHDIESAIIFCKTKRSVDEISSELQAHNYNVEAMHGDISQTTRMHTLRRFKDHKIKYLIATDVAARGIDVDHVSHVINYELPQEDELYVHRIGRTGRAGNTGEAYTIVSPRELGILRKIERKTNSHFVELDIPSIDDIFNEKIKELLFDIQDVLDRGAQHDFYNVVRDMPKSMRDDVLAALLKMNYDSRIGYDYQDDYAMVKESVDHDRLFINRGKVDKVNKSRLLAFLCDTAHIQKSDIGEITIKRKFSFVNVKKDITDKILSTCNHKKLNSRKINIEIAQEM
ncbi:MAG TPA: DEAD/DEAH box helicase [Erysipelotrichaceae bacterium]|nr:DEAD/DEAH box helicase [Erysipelotrichaceae bacterium]